MLLIVHEMLLEGTDKISGGGSIRFYLVHSVVFLLKMLGGGGGHPLPSFVLSRKSG